MDFKLHAFMLDEEKLTNRLSELLEKYCYSMQNVLIKQKEWFQTHFSDDIRIEVETFNQVESLSKRITEEIASSVPTIQKVVEQFDSLKKRIHDQQVDHKKLQKAFNALQVEHEALKSKLNKQHEFCAKVGAILGKMLWKVSQTPESVTTILKCDEDTFNSFIKLSDAIIFSHVEMIVENYSASPELSSSSSTECKFTIAMCGTLMNIAAQPGGRRALLSENVGRIAIENLLNYLCLLPNGHSDELKRLIIMFLYNVTISKRGLFFLQTRTNSMTQILEAIKCNTTCTETKALLVKFVLSLMKGIANEETLRNINVEKSVLAQLGAYHSGIPCDDLKKVIEKMANI